MVRLYAVRTNGLTAGAVVSAAGTVQLFIVPPVPAIGSPVDGELKAWEIMPALRLAVRLTDPEVSLYDTGEYALALQNTIELMLKEGQKGLP